MIKKIFILLLALLPLGVKAQRAVGSWEVYANFLAPEHILQTPDKVYCLSSGSLFSFDKNTEELYMYGIHNVLSEATISNIYYNARKNYLVLAYKSGNIDVILKDGKVVNLPDIRDAILQTDRTINDVSFADGRIYVATNFGIVIFDDKRWEVKESGIYDVPVKYVAATDEYIGAYFPNEKKIGFMPVDKTVRYKDNFVLNACTSCTGLRGLKGNTFLGSNSSGAFSPKLVVYNPETQKVSFDKYVADGNYTGPFENKNGYYIYNTVTKGSNVACIKEFDTDYNVTTTPLPADFSGKLISMWDDPSNLFIADGNGVSEYAVDADGNLTLLHDSFKPEAITSKGVGTLTASNSGKLYIAAHGYLFTNSGVFSAGSDVAHINLIENNKLKDITPSGLTLLRSADAGVKDGTYRPSNVYNIIEDPDDPDTYYFSTAYDGMFKIKDGREVNYYNIETVPFSTWAFYNQVMDIDGKGNMWVARRRELYVLPADKRKSNVPTTHDDWYTHSIQEPSQSFDPHILACKKSNIVMFTYRVGGRLLCVDTKGTATPDDDTTYQWRTFIDQDGKEWPLYEIYALLEDNNGQVWVGTDQGVFIIPDPKKLTDPNMRIQRIKVPRNDGTNFADYLLEGEAIQSLAVDGANRKWIGTTNSGAYLVSENGSQIIEHFTTENSYLPYDAVYAIACDKFSNAVYFGTAAGLVKYNSDVAPAADDYSDVYAYPNPVRPEYNGHITIAGLMDNSLIKITDAAGNVFFQGTSQGGMLTWDGCDASGNRVKTGVYYVFASQNGNSGSSGAVTKILVVK